MGKKRFFRPSKVTQRQAANYFTQLKDKIFNPQYKNYNWSQKKLEAMLRYFAPGIAHDVLDNPNRTTRRLYLTGQNGQFKLVAQYNEAVRGNSKSLMFNLGTSSTDEKGYIHFSEEEKNYGTKELTPEQLLDIRRTGRLPDLGPRSGPTQKEVDEDAFWRNAMLANEDED